MDNLAIGFTNKNRLAGQRFGRLTVIEKTTKTTKRNGNLLWKCSCDCGNEILLPKAHLLKNHSVSCGCLRKEKALLTFNNRKAFFEKESLVDKRIGLLKVLERSDNSKTRHRKYKCICFCGKNMHSFHFDLVKPSNTPVYPRSCGCRGKGLIEKFQDADGLVKWRLIETKQVIPIGLWEE